MSLQVIGAGFSRTGTVSFSKAIETLLGGSVCHSGTNCLIAEPEIIKKWTTILKAHPETDKEFIKDTLQTLLSGYVGVTDVPGALFVSELLEVFPDAKVICTTRETESWFRSCSSSAKSASKISMLLPLFWPLPTIRWLKAWIEAILIRASYLYLSPIKAELDINVLAKHNAYVERVVPEDRLFFFNVRDGWGPLCKILDCPVPDEPFPKLNNADENREFMASFLKKALWKWLEIVTILGTLVFLLHYAFK